MDTLYCNIEIWLSKQYKDKNNLTYTKLGIGITLNNAGKISIIF